MMPNIHGKQQDTLLSANFLTGLLPFNIKQFPINQDGFKKREVYFEYKFYYLYLILYYTYYQFFIRIINLNFTLHGSLVRIDKINE